MNQPVTDWLENALEHISSVRVAVFGDFCLDAYWLIDADESELSVEMKLPIRRVRRQHYSLGGAGTCDVWRWPGGDAADAAKGRDCRGGGQ